MMNENAVFFWDRTKSLVKERHTTQEWLALQCGVSLNVLKSWIFNKRLPDATQAVKIAMSLGTTAEYLVTGEDTSPLAQENAVLKEKLKKISEIAGI